MSFPQDCFIHLNALAFASILTLSIEFPSRHMCGCLGNWEILCLVPVNRQLVLRTLRLRRLEPSHCFRLLRSWVRDENSPSGILEAYTRLVSSAYILTSDRRLQFGSSLMYNRNSRGPRNDPSGTPQRMKLVSEFTLLITVTWVLPESKARKRLMLAPLNPYSSNFDKRIRWSIVSNVFFKSINRMAFVKPSSIKWTTHPLFFAINGTITPWKQMSGVQNIDTEAEKILRICPSKTRSKLRMESFTLDATIIPWDAQL